jgi:hypothetical protein
MPAKFNVMLWFLTARHGAVKIGISKVPLDPAASWHFVHDHDVTKHYGPAAARRLLRRNSSG